MPRPVADWLRLIQRNSDLTISRDLLDQLEAYHEPGTDQERRDAQNILNLLTAVRLDQMAKENS